MYAANKQRWTIAIVEIANKLTNCPGCGGRLQEVKEDCYKCPGCNARVEQLTLFGGVTMAKPNTLDGIEATLKQALKAIKDLQQLNNPTELLDELQRLQLENKQLKTRLDMVTRTEQAKQQQEENEERLDLAYFIKQQREYRGLSQNKVARLIGSTSTTIANYENGKGKIEGMRDIAEKVKRLESVKK